MNMFDTEAICAAKNFNGQYQAYSLGFSKFIDMNTVELLGKDDYYLSEHRYAMQNYSTDFIAEQFIAEDERAFRGEVIAIFCAVNLHNKVRYLLTQKFPKYNDKQCIDGAIFRCSLLTDLDNSALVALLDNPFIEVPDYTLACLKIDRNFLMHQYGLTKKERQCLSLTMEGKTAKDIAKSLSISYRTVERHISQVTYKLGCENKLQAVAKAYREKIYVGD